MGNVVAADLDRVSNFEQLVDLLRDKLEWPIGEDYGFDDIVFEYESSELGLKKDETAKIREIHQLRPLVTNQPWGIFFISMEDKAVPVTVLRRILRALVVKKRSGAQTSDRRAWDKSDLIFAASFGTSGARELAFIHFSDVKTAGDMPVMKVLGWNAQDTRLHNEHVAKLLREKLIWPDDPEDTEHWRTTWASAFELRLNQVIKTSKDLAIRLADLASDIRALVNQLLEAEDDTGPMRTMLSAFQKNLIHDLDDDGFADMFAQTIAYGMLAARISRPAGIVADNLSDMVPRTNPFLMELFGNFLKIGGRDKRMGLDFDELGIRDVVDVLNDADMEAVLRDFGDRNPKEDPVIHFYELFLKEYDPQKRMQRGVFYTPRPVVSFIIRGVDEILRTEFGLPLGLADTSTWAEVAARNDRITIPAHVEPDAPFVQILDPATGTGTFLVEVIDLIYKRMKQHWKAQGKTVDEINAAWNDYVPRHLLSRLTAFELLMAPYTIAHMKVGLKLSETGYTFGSDERARIFLTNALEPARDVDMEFDFMSEALAHEAKASNGAKAKTPFTAVLGNPPYSGISKNMFPWIDGLLKGREPDAHLRRSYYEVDGVPLGEKKIWLQDDYVKFLRLSQYLIERSSCGVLGVISNNGYLDNPTFRGMRWHLMQSFPSISIIDLHGSTKKKETSEGGGLDQNVFDIEQGVGIGLFSSVAQKAGVSVRHVYGDRETKFNALLNGMEKSHPETLILPSAPFFFFKDQDETHAEEYRAGTSVAKIFPSNVTGILTARDHVAIGFDVEELSATVELFRDASVSDPEIRNRFWPAKKANKYSPGDSRGWKLPNARLALQRMNSPSDKIHPLTYRPFDIRKVFYDPALVDWGRWDIMPSMTDGENIGLVTTRQCKDNWDAKASSTIIGHKALNDYDINSLLPLWLQQTSNESVRRPNIERAWALGIGHFLALAYEDGIPRGEQQGFGPDFQRPKAEQLGPLDTPWDGRGDLTRTFGPRDLFDYIYAVLHSPGYRKRYAEFLKSDFPRIPTPKDRASFAELVPLGRDLVALHLLRPDEAPILERSEVRFAGSGEARVENGYPKYENGKVMINGSRWFEDVPQSTWEFHVGGYQVCQKWLKDRAGKGGKNPQPGRILTVGDILHYRRVVVALTETRRLMAEIDHVIEGHGGWPDAFYQPPPPPPSVEEIIGADESKELEFKSTFQWDMRERKQNKVLQKEVLKTLAAFMNSDGGTLVIGVADDKEIIGLEHDLKLVQGSLDAFENRLLSVFSSAIGAPYSLHCTMRFPDAQDGKKVCVIEVNAAKEPVFVDFQGQHEFFIRRGNATVSLNARDQYTYIRQRF
ncbi:MAG: putative DNA binding domain-containing protein [Boseongicola sp.]|nr:putative DNA binding domain-containing protein [Boseongicola sp.]